jgi:hypothetical protein
MGELVKGFVVLREEKGSEMPGTDFLTSTLGWGDTTSDAPFVHTEETLMKLRDLSKDWDKKPEKYAEATYNPDNGKVEVVGETKVFTW